MIEHRGILYESKLAYYSWQFCIYIRNRMGWEFFFGEGCLIFRIGIGRSYSVNLARYWEKLIFEPSILMVKATE